MKILLGFVSTLVAMDLDSNKLIIFYYQIQVIGKICSHVHGSIDDYFICIITSKVI